METILGEIQGGTSLAAAALVVSQGFATAPESAPYAALLTLVPPPIDDPTPQQSALVDSFINQTFTNLFDRSAEVSELALWSDAYFQGAIPFADMVYDIASAAQGDDVAVMNAKIQAASYFTRGRRRLRRAAVAGRDAGRRLRRHRPHHGACLGGRHQRPGRLEPYPDRLSDDPVAAPHHHRRPRRPARLGHPDRQPGHERHAGHRRPSSTRAR